MLDVSVLIPVFRVIFGPNITGNTATRSDDSSAASGAFYNGNTSPYAGGVSSSGHLINFNATRSSSLYGASSTVQVNSFQTLIIIKT